MTHFKDQTEQIPYQGPTAELPLVHVVENSL